MYVCMNVLINTYMLIQKVYVILAFLDIYDIQIVYPYIFLYMFCNTQIFINSVCLFIFMIPTEEKNTDITNPKEWVDKEPSKVVTSIRLDAKLKSYIDKYKIRLVDALQFGSHFLLAEKTQDIFSDPKVIMPDDDTPFTYYEYPPCRLLRKFEQLKDNFESAASEEVDKRIKKLKEEN